MNLNIRTRLFGGVALCGLVLASATAAQTTATPNDPNTSGEVLVTAQKRSERLLNVPLPVQAVSAQAIE
ncbi:hypothetical protein ABTM29_19395, partial [Acinetobacter baumannii]